MNRLAISRAAPTAPACFPDRSIWLSYLQSAQEDKTPSSRPFDSAGVYQASFSYCRDCNPDHRREMTKSNGCKPGAVGAVVRIVRRPLDMTAAERNAARRVSSRITAS